MTPSFQERSEVKGDGGTNPDEGRIGGENSVTPTFRERSEVKGDGGFSETQDLKSAGSGESNLDSRTNSDPSETNPDEGRIGKEKEKEDITL